MQSNLEYYISLLEKLTKGGHVHPALEGYIELSDYEGKQILEELYRLRDLERVD